MRGEDRRDTFAYWLYRSAAWLGLNLPERVGRPVYTAVGHLAYRWAHRTRRVVAGNMSRVLGRDRR